MSLPHVTIYTDGACLGNPGPGGYGAEVNVGGKVIYGYNFIIRDLTLPLPEGVEFVGEHPHAKAVGDPLSAAGEGAWQGVVGAENRQFRYSVYQAIEGSGPTSSPVSYADRSWLASAELVRILRDLAEEEEGPADERRRGLEDPEGRDGEPSAA